MPALDLSTGASRLQISLSLDGREKRFVLAGNKKYNRSTYQATFQVEVLAIRTLPELEMWEVAFKFGERLPTFSCKEAVMALGKLEQFS